MLDMPRRGRDAGTHVARPLDVGDSDHKTLNPAAPEGFLARVENSANRVLNKIQRLVQRQGIQVPAALQPSRRVTGWKRAWESNPRVDVLQAFLRMGLCD